MLIIPVTKASAFLAFPRIQKRPIGTDVLRHPLRLFQKQIKRLLQVDLKRCLLTLFPQKTSDLAQLPVPFLIFLCQADCVQPILLLQLWKMQRAVQNCQGAHGIPTFLSIL